MKSSTSILPSNQRLIDAILDAQKEGREYVLDSPVQINESAKSIDDLVDIDRAREEEINDLILRFISLHLENEFSINDKTISVFKRLSKLAKEEMYLVMVSFLRVFLMQGSKGAFDFIRSNGMDPLYKNIGKTMMEEIRKHMPESHKPIVTTGNVELAMARREIDKLKKSLTESNQRLKDSTAQLERIKRNGVIKFLINTNTLSFDDED